MRRSYNCSNFPDITDIIERLSVPENLLFTNAKLNTLHQIASWTLHFFFFIPPGNLQSPRVPVPHKEPALPSSATQLAGLSLPESQVGIWIPQLHHISWIQRHFGNFSITLVTWTIFHFIKMLQNASTCFAFQNGKLMKNQRKSRCSTFVDRIESPTRNQASESKTEALE